MDQLINIYVRIAVNACSYTQVPMKYKNTTFVNILLIYSHYKPGKPFMKGAPLFGNPLYVISTPILLLPFAGCQSAFSQNHSQNVNEVLLT